MLKGIGVMGAVTLSGCASNSGGNGDSGNNGGTKGKPASSKPFKLGMLTVHSGPFGGTGDATISAAQVAVDKINNNGGLNGSHVKLLPRDDEGSADTGLKRTRQLVTEENIDAMYTASSVSVLSSVRPYLLQQDIPIIDGGAVNMNLTGEDCAKNYFRVRQNIHMRQTGAAEITKELTKGRKVAAVEPDYDYGHKSWKIYKKALNDRVKGGIEVVNETFPAFGKGDFQTEIQQTLNAKPDILHTTLWVGDLVSFIQQAENYNLYDNIETQVSIQPMIASHALGKKMIRFIGCDSYYFRAGNSSLNKDFISKYSKKTGLIPNTNAGYSFNCLWSLKKAVDKSGGTSTGDIVSGLEGLTFEGLLGDITIRKEDHQGIFSGGMYGGWTGPIKGYDDWGIPDPITVPGKNVTLPPNCTFNK